MNVCKQITRLCAPNYNLTASLHLWENADLHVFIYTYSSIHTYLLYEVFCFFDRLQTVAYKHDLKL